MPKMVEEHHHGKKLKDVYLAMYKKKRICGIGVDYAKIPNMAMMYVYQHGGDLYQLARCSQSDRQ